MIYWEKGINTFKISENFIISLDWAWGSSCIEKRELLFIGKALDRDRLSHEQNIPNFTLQGFQYD